MRGSMYAVQVQKTGTIPTVERTRSLSGLEE